jgi:hypothetical protein
VRRALPVLLCLPLLVAGCSSSSDEPAQPDLPAQSDFRAGACRSAAPDLLALGRTLPRLGDDRSVEQDVQESLRTVQDGLVPAVIGAEPQYAAPLQDLVETIGGVRIRAVGNTYEVALGEDLRDSWERVLELCTASS